MKYYDEISLRDFEFCAGAKDPMDNATDEQRE